MGNRDTFFNWRDLGTGMVVSIIIEGIENGPNLVKVNGEMKHALCRCGGSNNKPFCDGTHRKIGFKAPPHKVEIQL